MTTFRAELRVLTPVHIGNGEELRHGFDYVVHEGKTWRLDVERLLEARFDQWARAASQGDYPPPGQLLTENDFQNRTFFRYVLPGVPRSQKTYAALREFIKDPWDRPYIPGPSIKGAIRTALAWAAWEDAGLGHVERQDIGRQAKFAGQRLERHIFGKDPNHDLLRALQVSDFFGPKKPGEGLVVVNARVVTRKGLQAPVPLEAAINVTFTGTIKIDDYLLQGHAARQLGFGSRVSWLTKNLFPYLKAYSQARLEALVNHFAEFAKAGIPGADAVVRFLEQYQHAPLAENEVLLALGWGTGWDGKTFWTHLQEDTHLFEALVKEFRLQRRSKGAPQRKPGDPFPSSRRVIVKKGRAIAPLGWAILTLKEKSHG